MAGDGVAGGEDRFGDERNGRHFSTLSCLSEDFNTT
jgi:hypothetical protein